MNRNLKRLLDHIHINIAKEEMILKTVHIQCSYYLLLKTY